VWHVEAPGGHRWPGRKDMARVDGEWRSREVRSETRDASDWGPIMAVSALELDDDDISLFSSLLSEVDPTRIRWT
jgi:hypothetical protein